MNPEPLFVVVVVHAVHCQHEHACGGAPGSARREEIASDGSGKCGEVVLRDDEFTGVLIRAKATGPLLSQSVYFAFMSVRRHRLLFPSFRLSKRNLVIGGTTIGEKNREAGLGAGVTTTGGAVALTGTVAGAVRDETEFGQAGGIREALGYLWPFWDRHPFTFESRLLSWIHATVGNEITEPRIFSGETERCENMFVE
jgi:hypothetical protein